MIQRFGLALAIFVSTTLLVGTFLSAAVAQTEESDLQVIAVETGDYPTVAIGVSLPPTSVSSGIGGFELSENGEARSFTVETLANPVTVGLVFDTSGSMVGAPLAAAKTAAKTCIRGLPAGSKTALITYDDQVVVRSQATDNLTELESLIDGLSAQGETATYSALWNAAILLGPSESSVETQSSRFLVLVSDGEDTVSKTTREGAIDMLQSVDLGVLALAITSGDADFPALRNIVEETSGVFASGGTGELNRICEGIGERLTNRYVLRYESAATGSTPIDITYSNSVSSLTTSATAEMPNTLAATASPPATEPASGAGSSESGASGETSNTGGTGEAALGSGSTSNAVAQAPPEGGGGEGADITGGLTRGEGTTTGTVNDNSNSGSGGGGAGGQVTDAPAGSDNAGAGTGSTNDLGPASNDLAFDSAQGTVDLTGESPGAFPTVDIPLPNTGAATQSTGSAGAGLDVGVEPTDTETETEVAADVAVAEPAVSESFLSRLLAIGQSPRAIWAGAALIGLATALVLSMGFSSLVVFGAPPKARANLSRTARVRDPIDGRSRISSLLSSLSGFFDRLLEGRGDRQSSINVLLERAGMAVRPGELLAGVAVVTVLVASVVLLLGYAWIALAALVVVPFIARFWIKRKGKKRRDAFKSQLGDTLMIMSGSLQAGHSLMRSISSVASQAPEPTAEEFSRVVTETRIGRDPIDSLNHLAERIDSEDLTWTVRAMALNRELGGNLSEILDNVGETIRDRGQVADQVRALSSEGKFSAYTLFALPFVVALAVSVLNPGYLVPLFQTTLGNIVIGVALTLLLVGAFWIKKIITLDY